jgi:hypothetical protein
VRARGFVLSGRDVAMTAFEVTTSKDPMYDVQNLGRARVVVT